MNYIIGCFAVVAIMLSFPASAEDLQSACQMRVKKKVIVPVMANGRVITEAHMTPDMHIDADDILNWVIDNMNDDAIAKFKELSSGGAIDISQMDQAGFSLVYDPEQAALEISPDPEMLKRMGVSLQPVAAAPEQEVLAPAGFSAFMNFRGGESYVDEGVTQGRQPARLDLDGAVNMKGWVAEGRVDYLEDDARPWERNEVRLVHDWQDKMVRLAVGDLSYPVSGFQSYQPMLGVSVARNFDLQPYRVTEPAGEASFVIRVPSRVDVLVNGQKARTLHIDPGSYSVSDFPVTDGSNDVTLVITDATGRMEKKTFSLLGDQQLLKQGLHAYAYNAGIESRRIDRQISYDGGEPALSFFHRYGFSDTLTAGISAQADHYAQQAGISALKAFDAGSVGVESFTSRTATGHMDVAANMSFRRRNTIERRDFSALLQYKGRNFTSLGVNSPLNTSSVEMAVRYSQPVFYDVNAGVGGRYRFGRGDAEDDWSYSVSCSKALSGSVTLTLNGEQRRSDGAGIFIGLTWSPFQSYHSFSSSLDTLAGTQAAEWSYRADHALDALHGGAGVTHDTDGKTSGTGNISYAGYRGEASIRHDLITGISGQKTDSRSEALFGTALAYAGGHVAVTRPVTGSFVILAGHKSLDGHDIGINPEIASGTEASGYQAKIDNLGPAVLPDATPYMYRPVKIDTRHLPVGYDIGRDIYTALPSYKSGTSVLVGNAANVFADGYALLSDGSAIALQGAVIYNEKDGEATKQEFFTNAQGRFRISHLHPGTYYISFYKYPEQKARLVIPEGTPAGRMDAGKLALSGGR